MEPLDRYYSFPVQLIKREGSVLIARGNKELVIEGPEAFEAVTKIMVACSDNGELAKKLLEIFPPEDRDNAAALIKQLIKSNFLSKSPQQTDDEKESSTDVFFWNFQFDRKEYRKRLQGTVVVVGINTINRQLCKSLQETGFTNIKLIDYDHLRNLRFYNKDGSIDTQEWNESLPQPHGDETSLDDFDLEQILCLIASSDFGGTYQLLDWNRYCVENNLFFLPINLDRCIGKIGPFIIPGETACYQCLTSRENSNLKNVDHERAREFEAFAGQSVAGFLPSMASILGDFAAVELTKFFGRTLPWSIGELLEINLLEPKMENRRVLKMPRCSICSSMADTPPNSPLKHPFFPDNYEEYTE